MKKRYVNIFECLPGSVIAEDIYDSNGMLIISKKATATEYIINKLADFGIEHIAVYEPSEVIESNIKQTDLIEFRKNYKRNVDTIKQVLKDLASGKNIDQHKMNHLTESIYSEKKSNYHIIECINEVKNVDEYTYTHSINVSIYSMLISKWMNLSKKKVKDIVQAGLLHDIGKSRIPIEILNKKGPLLPNEFEQIKKHSVIGYNLTKHIPGLSEEIRKAILMHHEREDGNGYPFGIRGDKISLYAKIISVADVYDALTSERVYKRRITPFDTFREFEKIGYGYFDTKVMLTFLSNISNYYIGSKVRMNTGEIGEIVYVPPQCISKPIILIGDTHIDLSVDSRYSIVEMI